MVAPGRTNGVFAPNTTPKLAGVSFAMVCLLMDALQAQTALSGTHLTFAETLSVTGTALSPAAVSVITGTVNVRPIVAPFNKPPTPLLFSRTGGTKTHGPPPIPEWSTLPTGQSLPSSTTTQPPTITRRP